MGILFAVCFVFEGLAIMVPRHTGCSIALGYCSMSLGCSVTFSSKAWCSHQSQEIKVKSLLPSNFLAFSSSSNYLHSTESRDPVSSPSNLVPPHESPRLSLTITTLTLWEITGQLWDYTFISRQTLIWQFYHLLILLVHSITTTFSLQGAFLAHNYICIYHLLYYEG